jgi:hypothetical protein
MFKLLKKGKKMDNLRKKWAKKGFKIFSRKNKTDLLAKKVDFIKEINSHAENGQVLAVYGYMDCDGVEVDNLVLTIDANYYAVNQWVDRENGYSDCGIHYFLEKPSNKKYYVKNVVDRGLEAFENGHPHIIHR